jgi:peptidoglycan/LPS O-acetylase OafA/YrhL
MLTQLTNFLNRPIKPPLLKQGYHKHIEQYRGLCALLVLINHGTVHEDMLVNNFQWPGFMHYLGSGYLSVIMFFCISGYVIGISNDQEKLNVKLYLKKRMVRLYPIYIFAFILCLIAAGWAGWFVITGNLLFLQNDSPYGNITIPVFVNGPSWSLNYEVLYYLLFIALFLIRPKVWHLTFGMLLISILFIHCNLDVLFFVNYINGYYFWIVGLLIGWKIIDGKNKESAVPLLSMLFLHLCQHHLGLGEIILHVLKINSITGINWLFDIPFCIMIMSILVQKESVFFRFNKLLCYTLPAIVFIYLILNNRIFEDLRWIMCLIFWLLSIIFYNEKRISAFLLDKLTSVGKISYALYLLHPPVALIIKKTIFINYQPMEVVVKYLLWLILTFSLAILLELFLQPKIKKYFTPIKSISHKVEKDTSLF